MSESAAVVVAVDVQVATAGQEPGSSEEGAIVSRKRALEEAPLSAGCSTSSGSGASAVGDDTSDAPSSLGVPLGPKPPKAYRNTDFLNSHDARLIRVMCELQEPRQRLDSEGVDNIVMFFGSARAKPREQYEAAMREAEALVAADPRDAAAQGALQRLRKQAFLVPMFDVTRDLAFMLTEWSQKRTAQGLPSYVVGTGAGPGMMEAANEGAWRARGPSVGFGISLPFEDRLNPYVTPNLGFEFHYFFTRKFWMCYKCMGLVVAPGGLGTCDELFELITLMQTGKIKRKLPVILIGRKFWQTCIQWDAFIEYGMISEGDASQLLYADTAEEAFNHLIAGILRLEAEGKVKHAGE